MLVKLTGYAKVRYTIEVDADSVQDAIDQVDIHLQGEPRETLEDMNITDAEMCSEPEIEITEEHFKVRVRGIDYDVEDEDVDDGEDHDDDWYQSQIDRIISKLPTTVDVEVECSEDDLDDYIVDMISEKTGWLINGYQSYEILERN